MPAEDSGMRLIYITAATQEEATMIARELIQDRLAACANVLPPIRSLYWWEGAVQDDPETAMILKTRADLVGRVVERVKALHSYSCPCVVALPITDGNPDFLAWIAAETSAS